MSRYTKESLVGYFPEEEILVGKEAFSPEEFIGLVIQTMSKAMDGREKLMESLLSSLSDGGELLLTDVEGDKNVLQQIRLALDTGDVYIENVNNEPKVFFREPVTPEGTASLIAEAVEKQKNDTKKRKKRQRQQVKNRVLEENIMNNFMLVSGVLDFAEVNKPDLIEEIHIVRQGASTIKALKEMLIKFPNLKKVTTAPANFRHIFSEKKVNMLVENNIEFEVKRHFDYDYYDRLPQLEGYKEKRELYKSIFKMNFNPEIKKLLLDLDAQELINLDFIHMYLGGDPTSILKVSEELEINSRYLARDISISLYAMGYEYGDYIAFYSKARIGRLGRLRKAKKSIIDREEYVKNFLVYDGDNTIMPSENLMLGRLENWKLLQELIINHPEKWQKLQEDHPRRAKMISYYYQLFEHRGYHLTLEGTREHFGVSRERVRQLISSGLSKLFDDFD